MYPAQKIEYIKSMPNAELVLFLGDASLRYDDDDAMHYFIAEAIKRLNQLASPSPERLPSDVLQALEAASEALENCYSEDAMDAFEKVNTVLAERG